MPGAIVFIHGRAPKPEKDVLFNCWKDFLPKEAKPAAREMVYWADLFGYPANQQPIANGPDVCKHSLGSDLPDATAQAAMRGVGKKLSLDLEAELRATAWSWDFVGKAKDWGIEKLADGLADLTGSQFAEDVRNFFRDDEALRKEPRIRLADTIDSIRAGGSEVCLVAHSFGAVVAYETLRLFDERKVHTLITMGGPLAWCYDLWSEAKPEDAPQYLGAKEFPQHGLRNWVNVYDPRDVVATGGVAALSPQIGPEFRQGKLPVVMDCPIANTYADKSHHEYRGYLQSAPVKRALRLFLLETGTIKP